MDEEFPSNSHAARSGGTERSRARAEASQPKEEAKKVEQITTNPVKQRKKPLATRFKETFFAGDAKGVAQSVFLDILVPAARDLISDTLRASIDRAIYGSEDMRRSSRPSESRGHVSYNRMYNDRRREEPRREVRRVRDLDDIDEVILSSRVEADNVLDNMYELMSRYQQVTVADLYEMVGISGNFTDHKRGWTDLRGCGVRRLRNEEYLLILPRAENLP